MRLLHIVATPRTTDSHTLRISHALLDAVQAAGDIKIDTLHLFNHDLPAVAGDNIETKYGLMLGQRIDRRHAQSWRDIEALIAQFLAADVYVVSVPMWNFSIPYTLKYYIDVIVQPGYLFGYDEQGIPIGLCKDKKMVCITTRGADYTVGTPMQSYDMQEMYLRTIFGFVGITELQFISAQPMNLGLELREAAIDAAMGAARSYAAELVRGDVLAGVPSC